MSENKVRRSQQQRRRATANKLIEATIEVVNEGGYSALKANSISKRAGVTWGAAQHLFGSKENLLLVVANRTYEELSIALKADIPPTAPLVKRVERIIDVTWKAYQSDAYLAMVEILRGSRHQPAFNRALLNRQRTVSEDVRATWLTIFATEDLDERVVDNARDLVTLTLSGLASRRIFLKNERDPNLLFATLKDATIRLLDPSVTVSPAKLRGVDDYPILV